MSSEKIEQFWENATADDVARVMTGETVEARFWDEETEPWTSVRALRGWSDGEWVSVLCWKHCQVYREPSWWANKPDPGPGWRLLEKFPDESREVKDDVFVGGKWLPARWDDGKQSEGIWYRRRIEPVEPKFSVGQTVRVVGPKEIPALEWSSVGMAQYAGTTHTVKRIELLTNPPGTYYHLGEIDNWAFREDYLEAVEPKFAVGQMVRVVGPKGKLARHWAEAMDEHIGTVGAVKRPPLQDPEGMFYNIGQIVDWAFREDYLEAVDPEPVEAPNTYHYTNPGDVVHCPNGTVIVIGSKGFEVTQ